MTFSTARTLTAGDWQSWGRSNVAVVGDGVVLQSSPAIDETTLPIDAVDLATDDGALYALGPAGTLTKHDREQGIEQQLWRPGSRAGFDPSAVSVDGDRAYVTDRSGGRLVAISTRLQRQIGTIETDLVTPIELATTGGSVLALDAGGDGSPGRLVRIGQAGQTESVLDGLAAPKDLLVTGRQEGWVLDTPAGEPRLRSIDGERALSLGSLRLSSGEALTPTCLSRGQEGTLVLGCRTSDGEFVLCTYELGVAVATERHRQGRPWRTLVGAEDEPLYAAVGDGTCLELTSTERYTTAPGTSRYRGAVLGRFDAGTDEVEWHRLTLDLGRPTSGTQVRVRYVATDDRSVGPATLEALDGVSADAVAALSSIDVTSVWELASSDPAVLSAELSSVSTSEAGTWRRAAADAIEWREVDIPDPTDVLLEGATGRYLHVAIELRGSRTASPRVNAVEAFCPRQSYLRYLPDIYQEDEASAAFLERFLSIFESTFSDVEREIETITRYFDPGGVPSDSLEWLASWLAVDPGDAWPESARRELLARAPTLYKKRGTRPGMRAMIELYLRHVEPPAPIPDRDAPGIERSVGTDVTARPVANADGGVQRGNGPPHELFVLEHRDLDGIESAAARAPFERALAGPQSFVVYAGPFAREDHRTAVERIVDQEAPAHTRGDVVGLEQSFDLAGNTFLGVNSTLTDRELELGQTTLGGNAVLRGETDESQ